MGEKLREDTPARVMWSYKRPSVAIHKRLLCTFKPLIEAPLPPVIPFPLYVGLWGATNMQEMKVPHKTQPPKTLYTHPRDHAFSTRSQTTKKKTSVHWEINIFNIHLMDCMVLTAKITKKSLRRELCRGVSNMCLLHFSSTRLRPYKGL